MNPLEEAIIRTVAYGDVFDYPLTPAQIERYLIGCRAPTEAVHGALRWLLRYDDRLRSRDGVVCLAGRESVWQVRQVREAVAARLWPRARRYAAVMRRLPYVRMLAVTGALAVDNEPGNDIDFLVVTAPGRLWLCRGLLMLLVRLGRHFGDELCPNYLISERALELTRRNLYTAHELVQMRPLVGLEWHRQLLERNRWALNYLPNAASAAAGDDRAAALPVAGWGSGLAAGKSERSAVQGLSEALLGTPAGTWLETWEMQRKIRKLRLQDPAAPEVDFCADWCKGHFGAYGGRTLAAYRGRLERLGVADLPAQGDD